MSDSPIECHRYIPLNKIISPERLPPPNFLPLPNKKCYPKAASQWRCKPNGRDLRLGSRQLGRLCIALSFISVLFNNCISMIAMSYKWVNKYQLLVPFSKFIFLILHTEKSSHRYIVVVDNFAKPFRVHDYYLLAELIYDFLLFHILQWCVINILKYILGNYNGFNLDILLDCNINE